MITLHLSDPEARILLDAVRLALASCSLIDSVRLRNIEQNALKLIAEEQTAKYQFSQGNYLGES